jgi:dUTP pyrophosphatase
MTPSPLTVVRLDRDLPLPQRARPDDAGVDLYARTEGILAPRGGRQAFMTGISVQVPLGYVGLVCPRSGLAREHGVTCLNAPGVIDAGFRGEVGVVLINLDPSIPYRVKRGDRIAQLVLQPCLISEVKEAMQLPESARGPSGFGDSGR